jgi:hypothetical protein
MPALCPAKLAPPYSRDRPSAALTCASVWRTRPDATAPARVSRRLVCGKAGPRPPRSSCGGSGFSAAIACRARRPRPQLGGRGGPGGAAVGAAQRGGAGQRGVAHGAGPQGPRGRERAAGRGARCGRPRHRARVPLARRSASCDSATTTRAHARRRRASNGPASPRTPSHPPRNNPRDATPRGRLT